jgi:hypothetical protein
MNDCKGLFGRLFGHAYEAVYNHFPPQVTDLKGNADDLVKFINSATRRELEVVVCIRCGRLVKP